MIRHHWFFIFNVADIAVSVGACCIAWATLQSRESKQQAST
jgi:lipoprotein signal peptidase